MARKLVTDMSAWPSLNLEGNLIAPAMVASIDRRQAPEQTENDYLIRKGLTIREEISTAFRVGQSHLDSFTKLQKPSVEATRRFVRGLLVETFGFNDLAPADGVISFLAGGRVPIVVVPPFEEKLDRRSPTLSVDRSRSPTLALQDYLNDNEDTLWGLVTNGSVIRLMRDNASLTRPAYIEADLVQIFTNEDAASFAVLWSLIRRTRFGAAGTPVTDCALERWREAGSREGEAARDRLAAQVEIALKVLGSGFLEANPDLATRLKSGEVNLTEWFNELLRLVYRLIFLMVAEDRNLLHPETAKPEARKLYAEGYSFTALRSQCVRAASWDKHHDRFEGIKIVFRALASGEPALGLPALGGLFGDGMLPHLETARLRNRAIMEALYRLSWLSEKTGIVPVNWRAMETEELGSVYESLLELQPQLGDDGRTLVFASEAAEQKGNQRKTSGSYYTPDSLVQTLLDAALNPVLDKTEAEAGDPAVALLMLSVIDPACGSGHFLLAAARRIATRLARIRADGTPSLADFRHALRDVARCCIHGVDRNPMAVELTKVALWIETVDPGLPLGFFDAQIRCGDALLGVFELKVLETGIPDTAFKPLTGDDKEVTKYYAQKNKREQAEKGRIAQGFGFDQARDLLRDFDALRAMLENTVEQVEAKAAKLRALTAQGAVAWQLETACDLYVSAFLLPKVKAAAYAGPDGLPRRGSEMVPTSGTVWEWLRGVQQFGPLVGAGVDASRAARAFHWPLEFPAVMQRGGFDVVLGNPPWERAKLQDIEFFANRSAEVASAPTAAKRKGLVAALAQAVAGSAGRNLYDDYVRAKRISEAVILFFREADRYPLSARGDLNTYALFTELGFRALSPRGLLGMIVPSGIATESATSDFFGNLSENGLVKTFFDFENRGGFFRGLHTKHKFAALCISRQPTKKIELCFFALSISDIHNPEKELALTASDIAIFNPNTKTLPVLRARQDLELLRKIYGVGRPLVNRSTNENPWEAHYLRMFDMTLDSSLFSTERHEEMLPLYEAKMVWHFDHRWANAIDAKEGHISNEVKKDVTFDPTPRFYVSKSEVEEKLTGRGWGLDWIYVYRNVSDSRNERTFVSSVIPRSAVGNSATVLTIGASYLDKIACIIATANCLVFDYAVRQKVPAMNVNTFMVDQFPFLGPDFFDSKSNKFITQRVLELTYTSHSLAPFARDLGHDGPPFVWDEGRRAQLRAELDAFYACAYGLTHEELRYILDPADVRGADYPSETFRVLKEKEIRQYGEYRTRRLVLEAWNRMEADGTFANLGLTEKPQTVRAPGTVELPSLDSLADRAWSWPATVQPRDRLRYAAQYALWLMDLATDGTRARFIFASMAEPALLTPFLTASDRRQWIRLVGSEAQPHQEAIRLSPPINAAWRSMFETLLSSDQLEERADGAWTRGQHFSPAGLQAISADAQRAAFAIQAARNIDVDSLTAAIAPEDNVIWERISGG
jgi:hypothetical protein